MKLLRMFSYSKYKGEMQYLKNQTKYEIARTILYFFISFSLLAGGYAATHTRANLLTIVAVLGCLPACKSLVSAIMFCRYKSLPAEKCAELKEAAGSLTQAFDMVFTSYKDTFVVDHLVVVNKQILGYSHCKDFKEKEFHAHITNILALDQIKDVAVKIFTDEKKYRNRMEELKNSLGEEETPIENVILNTLKSVSL